MKTLVTGVTGFVGHHVVRCLTARGHEIHGLVRDAATENVPDGVIAHPGDVCDFARVRSVVASTRPDHIVHLAGASSVGRSFAEPVETWQVNLTGTLTVLEAVRAASHPLRVLMVTSGEIYGAVDVADLPVTEDTPLRPLSPYGASKAAADLAVAQYHAAYGVDAIRVRAFNHVGPGQDARFVLPTVAQQLVAAERSGTDDAEIRMGNLDTRRDFTDVRDMVEAYALLLEHGTPTLPYLACSGRSIAIGELVAMMTAHCRRPVRVVSEASRRREGEQPDHYGSSARLRRDTGWEPRIPLTTTCADILAEWRSTPEREN